MATAATENKRSWRSPPRGGLVRRSRYVWRWILSGLAIILIGLAVYWTWPRRLPQTMLLILDGKREERNILPPVPFAQGDIRALQEWAQAAKVPTLVKQLSEVTDAAWLTQSILPSAGENQVDFLRSDSGTSAALRNGDTLVIYVKGHGLALDISSGDKPDVRPLLVKSLSQQDLSSAWYRHNSYTLDVGELLKGLPAASGVRILVVLDAVHLNYDPRLGTLVNAFPTAMKQAVEGLSPRSNLSVVVGQSDGELAVGLSTAGRSALVDCLVASLQRKKNEAIGISLDSLLSKTQARLNELNQAGRGSFKQTLQKLTPPSGDAVATQWTLPASLIPPEKPADKKSVAGEVAKVAATAPAAQAVTVPAQQAATAAGTVAKAAKDAGITSQEPSGKEPSGSSAGASAGAVAGSSPQAGGAGASSQQLDDLELAWNSRDRLREKFRSGWSPAHISPQNWRGIEGLLAGFDEQRLAGDGTSADQKSADQQSTDRQTLRLLQQDLADLEALFASGTDNKYEISYCRSLAKSFTDFKSSSSFRSFQARQSSGLETANEALKAFDEIVYRARDYVYLHGQMAAVLDGGPFSDAVLDALLDTLKDLGSRLDPTDLLTPARARDLARQLSGLELAREKAEGEIESYCQSVAASPASPGKLLRVRLLLHSPAVDAKQRAALRKPVETEQPAVQSPDSASVPPINARLATNARLMKKLLAVFTLPNQMSVPKASSAAMAQWSKALGTKALDSAGGGDFLAWAALGRASRDFAENWPTAIQADFPSRSNSRTEPTSLDLWGQHETALLVDGRDADRWPDAAFRNSWIAQPIRPQPLADKIELATPSQPVQLREREQEAITVPVSIRIQSEKPAPYRVVLNLNWNRRDILDVKRGDTGAPLRNGSNDLLLESDSVELPLRIRSQRTSIESTTANVRAQASFGASQISADVRCLLPRPDEIELILSSDDDVAKAKRRTWFPSTPIGGRLNLFPNRERTAALYLTNLSSEEKRLVARLYRVPQSAATIGGRLFDIKSGLSLSDPATKFETRLKQPNADIAQLLRGQLIAQTNEKEPLLLSVGSTAVKIPLQAITAAPPTGAGAAAATNAAPADKSNDVTGGLLLVVQSADGKTKPHFKWIELQMLQPDDLLAIRAPEYQEGKLTFRVVLKDAKLIEEMGLAAKPLKLTWETQGLPPEIREPTKEVLLTADSQGANFSAFVPPTVRWPLYLQLHVDDDPRALVARLDRQNDSVLLTNLKENRPPDIHIWRVGATASRSNAPPERLQYLIRPAKSWLAFPAAASIAEGLPELPRGQPVLVRIDPRAPTARLDVSLGADVAAKYFAEGARVRVVAEGQPVPFATERQVAVRLVGMDAGVLQLECEASDFKRIEFGPIDVPPQDKRVELSAQIASDSNEVTAAEDTTSRITFILDRTPPTVERLHSQKVPPPAVLVPGAPIETRIHLSCYAKDGNGSGVANVEFVVGFDMNKNRRLDAEERQPPLPANRQPDALYSAEYVMMGPPTGEHFLVEAVATDNVQQTSSPVQVELDFPPPQAKGADRPTFGGDKAEDDKGGKMPKLPPPAKK